MNEVLHDDAPFEWLTNFRSLRHVVLPSRIVFGPKNENESEPKDDSRTPGVSDQETYMQLNALHVGCGTSTVGESLFCMRERSNNTLLRYGHVVNVDNNQHALNSLQRRWENRKQQQQTTEGASQSSDQHNKSDPCTMEWKCLDFNSEESCRSALEGVCHESSGGYFDLVLDKSTLDCLLCAESSVVAQLLCEVYRVLRVPSDSKSNKSTTDKPSSWGGLYVLVTFHPAAFVEKLLTQLPGANWKVEHEVIQREMEDISDNKVCAVDEEVNYEEPNNSADFKNNNIPASSAWSNGTFPASSAWSSGTFNPDENYRKTVTVFTCRRCSQSGEDETSLPYILDRELVIQHVEQTCNDWYQTINPMVTSQREDELRKAFLDTAAAEQNMNDNRGDDKVLPSADVTLDLKQCYKILFTEAEKENLTFEYFLEDWAAYCNPGADCSSAHSEGMTVAIALDFLKEMQ